MRSRKIEEWDGIQGSAERILILTSGAAIGRRAIEFGCEQKYRQGLQENAHASQSVVIRSLLPRRLLLTVS
jgi:hypothetical protein